MLILVFLTVLLSLITNKEVKLAWNGERNTKKERKRLKAKSKGSLAQVSTARADRKRAKDGQEIGKRAFVPPNPPRSRTIPTMLIRNKFLPNEMQSVSSDTSTVGR